METFVAASSTVLLAIVGYLFWLGACQRKLSGTMQELERHAADLRAHTNIAA